jgi:cytochrome P450
VRKDVLNRSFSAAAIESVESLVVDKTRDLCDVFEKRGKGADLHFAFRCMAMDMIMTLCFGKSIHAVEAEDFRAPIVVAMDASSPVFLRFKYSDLFKNMILKCPPAISRVVSPMTAGLVDLQEVC